jgi:hypothetical protein
VSPVGSCISRAVDGGVVALASTMRVEFRPRELSWRKSGVKILSLQETTTNLSHENAMLLAVEQPQQKELEAAVARASRRTRHRTARAKPRLEAGGNDWLDQSASSYVALQLSHDTEIHIWIIEVLRTRTLDKNGVSLKTGDALFGCATAPLKWCAHLRVTRYYSFRNEIARNYTDGVTARTTRKLTTMSPCGADMLFLNTATSAQSRLWRAHR